MAPTLAPRDAAEARGMPAVNTAFYVLQTAGLAGGLLMLLTPIIWHKVVRRHASWINFMVTWIISCVSYILLIGTPLGRTPNHTLCLIQASLIYTVPTLTAGSGIALVIHVYITLRSVLEAPTDRVHNRAAFTAALIILPYIPAWAMFVSMLRMGLSDPSIVRRSEGSPYCSMKSNIPMRVSAGLVATIMLLCLAVEIIVIRALRRSWATLKRDDQGSVAIIIRVLAFTLVGMLSIILSLILLALPSTQDGPFNIVIATLPISSVIVFGTQKDILNAWTFIFHTRRRTHGADTWDTFTPNESQRTLRPQVRETAA